MNETIKSEYTALLEKAMRLSEDGLYSSAVTILNNFFEKLKGENVEFNLADDIAHALKVDNACDSSFESCKGCLTCFACCCCIACLGAAPKLACPYCDNCLPECMDCSCDFIKNVWEDVCCSCGK